MSTMGAGFKWAVKHTEKNFAILKEEIGHHLQDLRAQEPTYRRDSDEKSQPLPPVTKMRPEARGNPGQVRPETASMRPKLVHTRCENERNSSLFRGRGAFLQ